MTTALISTVYHHQHNEPSHPERAARLDAVSRAIEQSELHNALLQLYARPASESQVAAVHSQLMIERVRQAAMAGDVWLNLDTYTTRGSWEAALEAAGAAVRAVEVVLNGVAQNAFALGRPPGHHASPNQSTGFCMFNNIAIAARYALDVLGMRRIAIVDYDVHHGNGTQDVFYTDDQVLFCSTHGYGAMFYPGTGAAQEFGEQAGYGLTLNIPLPGGAGDIGVQRVYNELVIPAVRSFNPQLILVSAGFDAHWADPLGPLSLSVAGYAALSRQLVALADDVCNGRIVFVLEGGYDLQALSACVVAVLRVLLGRDAGADPLGPADSAEPNLAALIARMYELHPLLHRV